MPDGVYSADELVYTALTKNQKTKKKSKYINPCVVLFAVIGFLALFFLFWNYIGLTSGSKSSSNECPHGYKYYGKTGACYKITIRAVSFEEAKRSCESDGTHLASIHSKKASDFLFAEYREKFMEFLRNNGTSQEKVSLWIGLAFEDGVWQWSDKGEVDYENWMYKTPGNRSQAVVQSFSHDDSWLTVPKHNNHGFICKKQLRFSKKRRDLTSVQESHSTTTAEPTTTKSEMEEGLGMAMKDVPVATSTLQEPELATKSQFQQSHSKKPSVLVNLTALIWSIHSKEELDYLTIEFRQKFIELLRKNETSREITSFWMGLSVKNGVHQWSDETVVDYEYTMNWKPGNHEKTVVEKYSIYHGYMTVPKQNNYGFICKKQLKLPTVPSTTTSPVPIQADSSDNKCTPGYTFFNETGFCYKVGMEERPFDRASRSCVLDGAHLASIHSVAENDFLNMLYLHEHNYYVGNLDIHKAQSDPWIGLVYKSGTWEWTDGTPVDYTNWAIGEPNNLEEGGRIVEHRVAMITKKHPNWNPNGKKWDNVHKYWYHPYFCKKPVIPVTTTTQIPVTTPPIVDDGNECPLGYRHFESYCYKVSIPAVTFEEAQKSCASEDAHLVSIHSSAENKFIPTLYNETLAQYRRKVNIMQEKTSIWIGFHFRNKKWQWSDRSEVSYTNWAPEKPNVLKKFFHTIMVLSKIPDSQNNEKWNNVSKGWKYGFVCKKKVVPVISGSEEGSGESE